MTVKHKPLSIGNRFLTVLDCPRVNKQIIVTNCLSCRYYNGGSKEEMYYFTSCLYDRTTSWEYGVLKRTA